MRIVAIADYERERTACPPVCGRPRRKKFCARRYLRKVRDGEGAIGPSRTGISTRGARTQAGRQRAPE